MGENPQTCQAIRPATARFEKIVGILAGYGGASLSIIGKSLGHTQAATTMIYARLQVDSVRESVTAATTGMLAAGGVVIDVDSVKLLEHKQPE